MSSRNIELSVSFKDHRKVVLTNKNGDTFTSKSEELCDFLLSSESDICTHPYNELVMSDKKDKHGLILMECKVCGKLL